MFFPPFPLAGVWGFCEAFSLVSVFSIASTTAFFPPALDFLSPDGDLDESLDEDELLRLEREELRERLVTMLVSMSEILCNKRSV